MEFIHYGSLMKLAGKEKYFTLRKSIVQGASRYGTRRLKYFFDLVPSLGAIQSILRESWSYKESQTAIPEEKGSASH